MFIEAGTVPRFSTDSLSEGEIAQRWAQPEYAEALARAESSEFFPKPE